MNGSREFPGAPEAAAQLTEDLPCLELCVCQFAADAESRVGAVGSASETHRMSASGEAMTQWRCLKGLRDSDFVMHVTISIAFPLLIAELSVIDLFKSRPFGDDLQGSCRALSLA